MGYIIDRTGNKIQVPGGNDICSENVALISDNTILETQYIVEVYEKNDWGSPNSKFIAERIFDKKPSDEEIIFFLSSNGISRYGGYAAVHEIRTLDFKDDEEK